MTELVPKFPTQRVQGYYEWKSFEVQISLIPGIKTLRRLLFVIDVGEAYRALVSGLALPLG